MLATPAAVHALRVPTPFAVGDVNCYLIDGHPLTLIDTGTKTEESAAILRAGLDGLGYRLGDIEQLILTHGHIDHIGLAAEIARSREAFGKPRPNVLVHAEDMVRVAQYETFTKQRMKSYADIMHSSGVSPKDAPRVTERMMTHYFLSMGESVSDVRPLVEGDVLESGIGQLRVLWVPGHSQGSICLVNEENRLIFSGDHILGDISSNPSLDFDVTTEIPMLTYLRSLDKLLPFDGSTILPGHRKPIFNLKHRVDELKEEYARKLSLAEDTLGPKPKTVYEISRVIYGNYDMDSMILALAECTDLLRILEQKGHARLETVEGVVYAYSVDD